MDQSLDAPTRTGEPGSSPSHRGQSSGPQARFFPGAVIAQRYRIVAWVGRGGMGEVYRADDLKLGQPVALKFLPEGFERDRGRVEQLLGEVRNARQVSHPNVCRVWDVGESEGRHFIAMEYVDGEDLASLLRRIGRLPREKAVQMARQLCAGLGAVHEQGIVHRDLKPSNVMLDGRGRVRITDFGVAGLLGEVGSDDSWVGTPAYMSPEQLERKEATVRSDVYALGLVLYELFTGKRAFEAASLDELRRLHVESTPSSPSHFVENLDPAVERAILRCLEKEPAQRPASVLAVAAALPGGDPLAAAVAAGETPSPELVAAAGGSEGLRPAVAWTCLATFVVGAGLAVVLGAPAKLWVRAGLEKSPEVLGERAKTILRDLGYRDRPADSAWGLTEDLGYINYVQENEPSDTRWVDVDRGVFFWYRESPEELISEAYFHESATSAPTAVTFNDPPRAGVEGMASVLLDPAGRLRYLLVVPQVAAPKEPASDPDWMPLFAASGLDPAGFTSIDSGWRPPVFADARAAWEGTAPGPPGRRIRIEAAAYRGRPVYFEIVYPWVRHDQAAVGGPSSLPMGWRLASVIGFLFWTTGFVGGALLAQRNLRLGRGDRRGAMRLGAFVFCLLFVVWVFEAAHTATEIEFFLFLMGLSWALLGGAFTSVLYLALEPIVRRRWPGALVSWSRLLRGDLRDPLVGRDILAGCVAAATLALVFASSHLLRDSFGAVPPAPVIRSSPMTGWLLVSKALGQLAFSTAFGLAYLFLLLLLRMLFRSQVAASAVFVLIWAIASAAQGDSWILDGIEGGLWPLAAVFLLTRFGLLSWIAFHYIGGGLQVMPIVPDPSAWYSQQGFVLLAFFAAIAVYAFRTSLGGHRLGSGQHA